LWWLGFGGGDIIFFFLVPPSLTPLPHSAVSFIGLFIFTSSQWLFSLLLSVPILPRFDFLPPLFLFILHYSICSPYIRPQPHDLSNFFSSRLPRIPESISVYHRLLFKCYFYPKKILFRSILLYSRFQHEYTFLHVIKSSSGNIATFAANTVIFVLDILLQYFIKLIIVFLQKKKKRSLHYYII
jgi:hypothetical protein